MISISLSEYGGLIVDLNDIKDFEELADSSPDKPNGILYLKSSCLFGNFEFDELQIQESVTVLKKLAALSTKKVDTAALLGKILQS